MDSSRRNMENIADSELLTLALILLCRVIRRHGQRIGRLESGKTTSKITKFLSFFSKWNWNSIFSTATSRPPNQRARARSPSRARSSSSSGSSVRVVRRSRSPLARAHRTPTPMPNRMPRRPTPMPDGNGLPSKLFRNFPMLIPLENHS